MKISFVEHSQAKNKKAQALAIIVGEDKKLSSIANGIDKASGGLLSKAIATQKFKGKRGQNLSVFLSQSAPVERVLIIGAGSMKTLNAKTQEGLGGSIVSFSNHCGVASVAVDVDSLKLDAGRIAHGALLKSYRFDKYYTKKAADEKPTLAEIFFAVASAKTAQKSYDALLPLANGIFLTRDVVSEPPNIIYPETLAERCMELKKLGVDVEVFDEPEMYKMGFGALLGVGQGSANESKMVIMKYNGLGKSSKTPPLAFVGKGVTFDTGGISIKPAAGMDEMKWDMGGAGTVIGLMAALAGRKAKVNVVGAVGLVENMPGGNAQRPGDVVKSYSGQTIEVLNTDAEGRLVLADVLWYTQQHHKPSVIVDLATLTGAIIVALGTSRAGLFSNNDKVANQLFKAGEKTGEEVWRLPLAEVYDKQINSDIADMQNIGKDREAGSITAAQFLQRFVNDTPWAHLDIAGTAWSKKDSDICPKGATAFGVRLLNEFVAENYES
jgi:leucyl aminopeptidase